MRMIDTPFQCDRSTVINQLILLLDNYYYSYRLQSRANVYNLYNMILRILYAWDLVKTKSLAESITVANVHDLDS